MPGPFQAGPLIEFWTPSQYRDYEPPKDFMLLGDCHLTRGNIAVLGGHPGVGKSRAGIGLAIAGATGEPWMGLEVHSKFRTLVLQVENGEYRMRGCGWSIGWRSAMSIPV